MGKAILTAPVCLITGRVDVAAGEIVLNWQSFAPRSSSCCRRSVIYYLIRNQRRNVDGVELQSLPLDVEGGERAAQPASLSRRYLIQRVLRLQHKQRKTLSSFIMKKINITSILTQQWFSAEWTFEGQQPGD